jgi:hypothetical protein
MSTDRLSHLQELIQRYYQQLEGKENTLLTIEGGERVRIEQQIEVVKGDIARVEGEYWRNWKSKAAQLEIADGDAEIINAEIVSAVENIEFQPAVQNNAELIKLLNEIKSELGKPTAAAGKLKTAIHLIPGFLSYEMELDTQGFLRSIFPMFAELVSKLKRPVGAKSRP